MVCVALALAQGALALYAVVNLAEGLMPTAILISTLIVWLSTVAVMVPSSLALDRGVVAGVLDGTGIAVVMLLLGLALFQAMRKRALESGRGRFTGTDIFLIVAWLPNVVVLAIVNTLCLSTIVGTGQHIGASALIYIVIPVIWLLGVVAGVVVAGIATSLNKRDSKMRSTS